jgi:putative ATPase
MDLFEGQADKGARSATREPLAARMRPLTLDEIVGQEGILGEHGLLRRAILADRLSSLILYGPPGSGKTSIAEVIARATKRRFERTSGVLANVAVLRGLLEAAKVRRMRESVSTILFIDEIHHFNKSQQDILLPYVEDGTITLIGATTHNPFFFINSPLTSRSLVFELEPLSEESVATLLRRSLTDERGLGSWRVEAAEDALRHLAAVCEGDARRALGALEVAALTTPPGVDGIVRITRDVAAESIQKKAVVYDHDEDGHYDTISAFIKSVRGSDPHAALYWLAKMLYAGEDPRFIVRRLIVLASEDIGNADPRGLTLAVSALQAVEFLGMPEARITLSQCVAYLATAPKSNAAIVAVDKALDDVKAGRVLPVPLHLRDTHYAGSKALGHEGYQYAHSFEGHFVDQEYMPSEAVYYEPSDQGYEAVIRRRMEGWQARRAGKAAASGAGEGRHDQE